MKHILVKGLLILKYFIALPANSEWFSPDTAIIMVLMGVLSAFGQQGWAQRLRDQKKSMQTIRNRFLKCSVSVSMPK